MNLLDKAISDIKQRKSNKTQDQTNPKLEGTSLTGVGSTLYRDAQYISDYDVKYLSKNVKSIISPIVNTDDIFYYLGFNIKNNTEDDLDPIKSFIFKIDFDKYNIEKFNQLKNYMFDKVSILTYNDLTSKFPENEKYDKRRRYV